MVSSFIHKLMYCLWAQFIALLFGLIYLNQELTQEGVMNINGVLFLFLTNMTFQQVFGVVNVSVAKVWYELLSHVEE